MTGKLNKKCHNVAHNEIINVPSLMTQASVVIIISSSLNVKLMFEFVCDFYVFAECWDNAEVHHYVLVVINVFISMKRRVLAARNGTKVASFAV